MAAGGVAGRQGALRVALAFLMGGLSCYTLQQWAAPPGSAAGTSAASLVAAPLLGGSADRFHQAPCPPPRQPGTERRNLVLAAVGDGWSPAKWTFSQDASWDLVAIYYGNSTGWSCPECTLALRMPDSMKWQMVWALMTEQGGQWRGIWKRLRSSYDYVMVADDDLIMDACVIDTLFDAMRRHQLLAAQPSNCRGDDSDNPYWVHWQLPGVELHYVNVIEVTAPGIEMEFLDTKLRHLLERTYSGWGLSYCFSAAAHFPKARLAAIDAACMIHPARDPVGKRMGVGERVRKGLYKEGSIYARFGELTPFASPREEQKEQWEDCGYTPAAAARARQGYPTPMILGTMMASAQQQQITRNAALLTTRPGAGIVQLSLAAAAGAVAALWAIRSKPGPPRRALP